MKKLCYVATIPAVVHSFLRGHIQAASQTYKVTVICNSYNSHLLDDINARLIILPIERKPSPAKDIVVLIRLISIFRREQFDIIHSIMPKTGLIAMLAARICRIPTRIHTYTGQVWVTKKKPSRLALKMFDRILGSLATHALIDSPSQRDFIIRENVLPAPKAHVICSGSICGVDPHRFRPNPLARKKIRHEFNIPENSKVILFVGRLNRDKGMLDLAAAFNQIAILHPRVELFLVGDDEDVPFRHIQKICAQALSRIHHVSFTSFPENYMAAADIFCLPSYREGFGLTIIEAAACALPTVATRIYGITDAVKEGCTGLLFPPKDVTALVDALSILILNDETRIKMGRAAQLRALQNFSSDKITHAMVTFYNQAASSLMQPAQVSRPHDVN